MNFKKVASFLFGLAFISAIFLFTDVARNLVSLSLARNLFFLFGGMGLLFNILAFRQAKNKQTYNLLFWIGSTILFLGLCSRFMNWPYNIYIIGLGTLISGISFFYNPLDEETTEDENLLDNF